MIETWTSLASGGLLGLLGSLCNKGFTLLDKVSQTKLRQQEQDFELKKIRLEHQLQQALSTDHVERVNYRTRSSIREASYQHDIGGGKESRWVVNVVRLVRPLLTVGLVILTAFIWYTAGYQDLALRQTVVDAILFCTTAAMTWWFGDRVSK